jgi:hypothetical protein
MGEAGGGRNAGVTGQERGRSPALHQTQCGASVAGCARSLDPLRALTSSPRAASGMPSILDKAFKEVAACRREDQIYPSIKK